MGDPHRPAHKRKPISPTAFFVVASSLTKPDRKKLIDQITHQLSLLCVPTTAPRNECLVSDLQVNIAPAANNSVKDEEQLVWNIPLNWAIVLLHGANPSKNKS